MQTFHPPIDRGFVRHLLGHYPVDAERVLIEHPPHARGFSGASIVRLTFCGVACAGVLSGDGETALCLRGWPLRGLPASRLCELHRFLQFVESRGVNVLAVPLSSLRGSTLVAVNGRLWQLEPWLPGIADFEQMPTDARLQSSMETLARVHLAAAAYSPSPTARTWFREPHRAPSPAVRERLSLVEKWTRARMHEAAREVSCDPDERFRNALMSVLEHFQSSRPRLQSELAQLSAIPVSLQVCLRDVWHDHILFTGDKVTGLVDPSAARTESVSADLSRLLGSLLGCWNERWEFALRAYESVRPLSVAERDLLPVLQRSGALLSGMAWVERRIARSIPQERWPAVINRVENLRRQLESPDSAPILQE